MTGYVVTIAINVFAYMVLRSMRNPDKTAEVPKYKRLLEWAYVVMTFYGMVGVIGSRTVFGTACTAAQLIMCIVLCVILCIGIVLQVWAMLLMRIERKRQRLEVNETGGTEMYNRIILMGRITGNLELRQTNSGKEVINFSIAVDQYAKDDENKTDFFRCTAWGKTAVFIEKYFDKGSLILLEGSMHNDNYTDENGVKHYGMNVSVSSASFTGERRGELQ